MNETPGSTRMEEKRVRRALPFHGVALVLQGGGALGAYQAGVFQAIYEANIEVSWVCGTSIGAVNGALIVGNPPERRVERLREFWETITTPQISFLNIPWFSPVLLTDNHQTRYWANKMSILTTMTRGAPGFFSARPFPPINTPAEDPSQVSYYDTSSLKATLAKLVDFDLINNRPMRLSVGATHVRTGASTYFNSNERPLSISHILASASLPPGSPQRRLRANIIGTVRASQTRQCNTLSTTGKEIAHLFFRLTYGTRTVKCRSTSPRPFCERRKSIAPVVSTSPLSNTRKWKNIDTRCAASSTDSRNNIKMILTQNSWSKKRV